MSLQRNNAATGNRRFGSLAHSTKQVKEAHANDVAHNGKHLIG
jgi:hypothetical protein